MLGIPLGLFYSNAAEWVIHKRVLHGVGKKKDSMWNFHWGQHHRSSRKYDMYDPDYQRSVFGRHAQGKEAAAVAALMLAHAPLFGVAPYFTAAVWYSGANYMYKPARSHRDPEWAKKHLRSHYDHHMGKNQDANWCVTRPWFDWIMGTREPYLGTEQEAKDLERKRLQQLRRDLRQVGVAEAVAPKGEGEEAA